MLTFFVITVFILQVGNKNGSFKKKLGEGTMLWIGAVVAGAAGIVCLALVMPFLHRPHRGLGG